MPKTRFDAAKGDIESYFQNIPNHVYTYTQLSEVLEQHRSLWRLPYGLTARKFIEQLLTKTSMKRASFSFPSLKVVRFTWGDANPFEIAVTLRPHSYLTHYSAAHLHGLTLQIPKVIYVNAEQPNKPKKGNLSQVSIDRAFKRPPRETNNFAGINDIKIALLNGQHTGKLGVVDVGIADQIVVPATNIERTLIDMTVRPTYSGGIFEVLNAYRNAHSKNVSVNKMKAMLTNINYIYPYFQAIGFYLEKAGNYEESQISLFEGIERKFDFYLTHQMDNPAYSKKWRLFYPSGL